MAGARPAGPGFANSCGQARGTAPPQHRTTRARHGRATASVSSPTVRASGAMRARPPSPSCRVPVRHRARRSAPHATATPHRSRRRRPQRRRRSACLRRSGREDPSCSREENAATAKTLEQQVRSADERIIQLKAELGSQRKTFEKEQVRKSAVELARENARSQEEQTAEKLNELRLDVATERSANPPVMRQMVSTPTFRAASMSHGVSPIITASSLPALPIAARTRSGSGFDDSTSSFVVQSSATSRASRRSR